VVARLARDGRPDTATTAVNILPETFEPRDQMEQLASLGINYWELDQASTPAMPLRWDLGGSQEREPASSGDDKDRGLTRSRQAHPTDSKQRRKRSRQTDGRDA
jgi:hypothetical protein